MKRSISIACGVVFAAGGLAHGAIITGTITADNHYSLYSNAGGSISLIGGNESGASGSTGGYNWSHAETFTFNAGDTLYIAAWSDKAVAQGLIGEFNLGGGQWLRTGDSGWKVIATGIPLGTGSAYPAASQIASLVAAADAAGSWMDPFVWSANAPSTSPWGAISEIGPEANWVWANPDNRSNPLIGAYDADEYLIFRTFVPAPGSGAAALAAFGIAGLFSRRRSA